MALQPLIKEYNTFSVCVFKSLYKILINNVTEACLNYGMKKGAQFFLQFIPNVMFVKRKGERGT